MVISTKTICMDYVERIIETAEVLSDKRTVKKIEKAIERIEYGEFLTKEEMIG